MKGIFGVKFLEKITPLVGREAIRYDHLNMPPNLPIRGHVVNTICTACKNALLIWSQKLLEAGKDYGRLFGGCEILSLI